jgi:hypothetical protein
MIAPEVALRGDLADKVEIEVAGAGVLLRRRHDLVVGEPPGRLPDELLLVGQCEVHAPTLLKPRGGPAGS